MYNIQYETREIDLNPPRAEQLYDSIVGTLQLAGHYVSEPYKRSTSCVRIAHIGNSTLLLALYEGLNGAKITAIRAKGLDDKVLKEFLVREWPKNTELSKLA